MSVRHNHFSCHYGPMSFHSNEHGVWVDLVNVLKSSSDVVYFVEYPFTCSAPLCSSVDGWAVDVQLAGPTEVTISITRGGEKRAITIRAEEKEDGIFLSVTLGGD